MDRRSWLTAALTGAGALALGAPLFAQQAGRSASRIEVYKSPTCGCCAKWVDHVRAAGFAPVIHDTDELDAVKQKHGVPAELMSCHTGIVGGYVVEGHVPADVIQRLLKEKPKVVGIATPGMPAGSPGMEVGSYRQPYEVIAFEKSGHTWVFARR